MLAKFNSGSGSKGKPMRIPEPDLSKFWSKVDKTDTCWNWTAFKNECGYGRFMVNKKPWQAHRVSYAICHGYLPALLVCHSCDNVACVNPAHLFLGTNQDNATDRNLKGRQAKGIRNNSKLTDAQVLEIRSMAGRQKDIAAKFGIHQTLVSHIKVGRNWKHLK